MQEPEPVRWLQLTYKVPSEPSQKRVWVWRKLQNFGAYALQNSIYLLPASEEVKKQFCQLAHDIREMGGEASVFSVVAMDSRDEQRILQALLEARNKEYSKVSIVCSRFLMKAATLIETRIWDEHAHAEFAEVMEKVHILFRTAKRHDMLGNMTATCRAEAAEAIDVCEQMFRVLLDSEFSEAHRLLEMYHDLLLPATTVEAASKEPPQSDPRRDITPPFSKSQQYPPEASADGIVEPPI